MEEINNEHKYYKYLTTTLMFSAPVSIEVEEIVLDPSFPEELSSYLGEKYYKFNEESCFKTSAKHFF